MSLRRSPRRPRWSDRPLTVSAKMPVAIEPGSFDVHTVGLISKLIDETSADASADNRPATPRRASQTSDSSDRKPSDRFGFALPKNLRGDYRAWRIQTRRDAEEKRRRFSNLLSSSGEDYTDQQAGELVRSGLPSRSRRRVWCQLAGVHEEIKRRPGYYESLVARANAALDEKCLSQIDLDVPRTFQDNERMCTPEIQQRLRDILRAYSAHDPGNGYAQGMNFLVSSFLILEFTDEEAFWLLCHLMRIFPSNFDRELSGVRADTEVFKYYLRIMMPRLHEFFVRHEVDAELYFTPMIMSLFVSMMQYENAFMIWDRIMYHGPIELFRCTLKLLHHFEPQLLALEGVSAGEIVEELTELLKCLVDIDAALAVMPCRQYMEAGAVQWRRMRKRAEPLEQARREAERRAAVDTLRRGDIIPPIVDAERAARLRPASTSASPDTTNSCDSESEDESAKDAETDNCKE